MTWRTDRLVGSVGENILRPSNPSTQDGRQGPEDHKEESDQSGKEDEADQKIEGK